MIGRKPSVARGTKIVDKMIRQIENEISAFEAVHAKTAQKVENINDKKAKIAEVYHRRMTILWNIVAKFNAVMDAASRKLTAELHDSYAAVDAKKAELQDKKAEHTADIAKLERIRDKVATLAD